MSPSDAPTPESSAFPARRVLALTADLLFASRIRATAEAVGVETILVRTADALEKAAAEQRPARIFLDLDARAVDLPALIRRLKETERTADIELIAFVSHVREDAIAAARAAGADQVLPRSAFVRQLPALIAGPARF